MKRDIILDPYVHGTLLSDLVGHDHKPAAFLIIPVAPVTGIEDSEVLHEPMVDFWDDAWRVSRSTPAAPEERTALALNSKMARSQNQLHIHIACVLADAGA